MIKNIIIKIKKFICFPFFRKDKRAEVIYEQIRAHSDENIY
jgi:hypothetical protein